MSSSNEIIYCPCGRALECARTDLLETLTCPVCKQELQLDLALDQRRSRGYLTIVAGPDRCGEDLLLPIQQDLKVGSATNNWLYLPDEHVSPVHCTLRLEQTGLLIVEVAPAGSAQPFRAEIKPLQTLKIGPFAMRFTIRPTGDPNSSSVFRARLAAQTRPTSGQIPVRVPIMQAVTETKPFVHSMTSQRFRIARWAMLAAALLTGLTHGFRLARTDILPMWGNALLMLAVFWTLVAAARAVGLGSHRGNLAAIVAVCVAGAVECFFGQYILLIGLMCLGAGLVLTVARPARDDSVVFGTALEAIAVLVITISLIRPHGPIDDLINWIG